MLLRKHMDTTYPEADHDTEGDGQLLHGDEGATNFGGSLECQY